MNSPLLSARNLSKIYKKDGQMIEVLRGVSLDLFEGQTVAVMGSSGAGKSTLLHLLGTLEPPTSGALFYRGLDTKDFGSEKLAAFRNREIGFVFQFHYLLQEFTAWENVLMPALIAGESREEYGQRAKTLLEEVGLGSRLEHRPSELSGGEQQRVALARALVMHPRLLLADEPTGNLDSANARKIQELFLQLSRSRGATVLLVTHDERLAESLGRQVKMQDGRIISDSGPQLAP
jgi:lipoprotein-releasing system ATP-binding protein